MKIERDRLRFQAFWTLGAASVFVFLLRSLLATLAMYPPGTFPAAGQFWECLVPMVLAGTSLAAGCWKPANGNSPVSEGPLYVMAALPVVATFGLSSAGAIDAIVRLSAR